MTCSQAKAVLAAILEPINGASGLKQSPYLSFTFGQFVEQVYLPVYNGKWKLSTAMTEVDRLRFHLVKPLGDRALTAITRDELQKLLDKKANNLSKSVVSHLRFRVRSIFELAMSEGAVERNPATTLYTPRHCRPPKTKMVLAPEQLDAMINAVALREKLCIRLATFEGMRPGEIFGMQLGDVDLETGCLWIRRRLYRSDVDSPKNDRSKRQVALSTGTKELMTDWLHWLIRNNPDGWVFATESGKRPLSRDFVWTKRILPSVQPLGLEWATFQVMRRTHATLSKQAGVDAHTRSAQMGNTVDVNENEYAVSDFKTRREAVRKLEAALKVNKTDNGEPSE